jgi:hypothetical protein
VIFGKTSVAIIPARAGSQGLPGKNILPMCGKPLLAWTAEQAAKSRLLDEVILSTDGEDIASVGKACGLRVPFLRPAALATSEAPTLEVVRHALEYLRVEEGKRFDYTVLLEPTSPLREKDDIDCMLEELDRRSADYDSIVSLGQVSEHPSILKRWKGEKVSPFYLELPKADRRQELEPAWFPYGVAYIAKTEVLLRENTFYTSRCLGFPLQRYQNYEIDSIHDFICVAAMMRHQWGLV